MNAWRVLAQNQPCRRAGFLGGPDDALVLLKPPQEPWLPYLIDSPKSIAMSVGGPKIKLNNGIEIPAVGLGEPVVHSSDWRRRTSTYENTSLVPRNVAIQSGRGREGGGIRAQGGWISSPRLCLVRISINQVFYSFCSADPASLCWY